MEIALTIAVAVLSVLLGLTIVAYYRLRAKVDGAAKRGDDTKRLEERAPSNIAEYDDDMEIPAALIGARCKEIIEQLAPILKVTPVNLLREAIAVGLTGGRPVTEEMLDFIEEERKAMGLPPPPKPGPVDSN
jgi:hypothetical protein